MCRQFLSAGNLLDPTKWDGGTLPEAGFTCQILAPATLTNGQVFPPAGSAYELQCNYGGGGGLTVTGGATINANTVSNLESLTDTNATNLVINGNAQTSATNGWLCSGVTHITGSLTAGDASTAGPGLTVGTAAELTVDSAILATSNDSPGIYNEGQIVGNCVGIGGANVSDGEAGIYNTGVIVGQCTGTGGDSGTGVGGIGIHNAAGATDGSIIGPCIGTGGEGNTTGGVGIYVDVDAAIVGYCQGTGGLGQITGGVGVLVYGGTLTGDCNGIGGEAMATGGNGIHVTSGGNLIGAVSGSGGMATTGGIGILNVGTIRIIGAFTVVPGSGGSPQGLDNSVGSISTITPADAGDVRLGTPCYQPSGPAGTLDITADNPHDILRLTT